MGKTRICHRLCAGLICASGLVGCFTIDLSGGWQNGTADPLQAEIFKQYTLMARPGWWKPDPGIVLREIPAGTPLAEARAVMEKHRFNCVDGLGDEKGTYLRCVANRRTGRKTNDRIDMKIYYEAGRVKDIDVTSYYDVP